LFDQTIFACATNGREKKRFPSKIENGEWPYGGEIDTGFASTFPHKGNQKLIVPMLSRNFSESGPGFRPFSK
jgi:hypothetical protein